jgi:glutaredoxin
MRFIIVAVVVFFMTFYTVNSDAAIYKWVDKDGTVHFTDSPPSDSNAKVVNPEPNRLEGYGKTPDRQQVRGQSASAQVKNVQQADLPIVELFVTSWCGYCKKAEAYFTRKNIPFVKYDIEKDQSAARRKASLTQSRGVPFVLIGDVGIPGYSEAAFDKALRQYQ